MLNDSNIYNKAKEDPSILYNYSIEKGNGMRALKIVGVCLDLQNRDFKGIRAILSNGKTFKARRKQSTPYLTTFFPKVKNANYSGFVIDLVLSIKTVHKIILEYRLESGDWCLLSETTINIPFNSILKNILRKKPLISSYDYAEAYQRWIQKYDTINARELSIMKYEADNFKFKPCFSIICPTYNTPIKYLQQCIKSVINQTYPYWELCLIDDNSSNPEIAKILKMFEKKHPRIKVKIRNKNGHICNASNDGIAMAKHPFIALLDHDDFLPQHALQKVAELLNKKPDLDIIYSDEDKIDKNNNRFDPYFKSDFNYELLLSQNYISHFGIYRTSLVRKVGGFRPGYEGSQDWDLCLRCVEQTERNKIYHIPQILYHWRAISGSTAISINEKPYAQKASLKVIKSHLQRIKQKANVKQIIKTSFIEITYPLPKPCPKVSIIIPTKNHLHFLERIIDDLLNNTDYSNFEILILDNDSSEIETLKYYENIKNNKKIKLIHIPGEFNYSKMNNIGVNQAESQYICLLNNDISVINNNWLDEMMRHACRKNIGAVGAKLLYTNSNIQHAGVIVGIKGVAGHAYKHTKNTTAKNGYRAQLTQNYLACTAACLVMKRDLYLQTGGMDEENLPINYNDIDLCLKIHELGYHNIYTPKAQLFHLESASRKSSQKSKKNIEQTKSEIAFFTQKWEKYIKHDPYFNKNFSRNYEDFRLEY